MRRDLNLQNLDRISLQSLSTTTPVPMTFVYDEATLTTEGRRATHLLLEGFLIGQKFSAVTLSGHADERGSPDYNMELSRQRLDTILRLLRDWGVPRQDRFVAKGCDRAVPRRGSDTVSARRTYAAGSARRTPRCEVEILQLRSAHSLAAVGTSAFHSKADTIATNDDVCIGPNLPMVPR